MKIKKLTPLPKLLKKAQSVFNKWIRERDKDKGCISCGGSVDHAGHYFSQGQHSFLRFNEYNVNGQCVGCNTFKHGNLILYRMGLIKRYGDDIVYYLESHSGYIRKWTRDELNHIIETYG